MNNGIQETTNEGEGGFNFDAWVRTNNLAEIKDLFIKHKATTSQLLKLTSPQFKNLMVDPQLFAKSHMIPRIYDAMQKMHDDQPKQRVVIAEDEEIAMEEMKENLTKVKDIEAELNDLKHKYPKSIKRIQDVKLRQIQQTKNNINKSFQDINNALNIKKQDLLVTLQQIQQQVNQQEENKNDNDYKENDLLSNCAKDLRSESQTMSNALETCNNMIDSGLNKNRKKRKEDIKKIAKETNDKFNSTKNEINKNIEIVKNMIDTNDKKIVKINFEVHNKKYNKILNKINNLGIIVNKEYDPDVQQENKLNDDDIELKEDEDDLKIKKLEQQLGIKNEEIDFKNNENRLLQQQCQQLQHEKASILQELNSLKRVVINSLSFDVDSKYRWYFENDEKENAINIGKIDDQSKSIALIDGNIKTNILQKSISTKPVNHNDCGKFITILKQNLILHTKHVCIKEKWDPNLQSDFVINQNVITRPVHVDNGWRSAFLSHVLDHGQYEWKFKIKKVATYLMIGIYNDSESPQSNFQCDLHGKEHAYTFYSSNGNPYVTDDKNCNGWIKYGVGLQDNDSVIMKIDFDSLCLSYTINGTDYGKACNFKQGKYRAAISACRVGFAVELID